VFAALKLLAFLMHEILNLVGQDGLSRLMQETSRIECFENIRVGIKSSYWNDWEELYNHIYAWNSS
jgi:hypothetical protein